VFFLLSIAIWLAGSASFKYQENHTNPVLEQIGVQWGLWESRSRDNSVSFKDDGIELSLTQHGNAQVYASVPYKHSGLTNGSDAYLQIAVTMERLSAPMYYRLERHRPTLSVRPLNANGELRRGAVIRASGMREINRLTQVMPVSSDVEKLEIFWLFTAIGSWRLSDISIRELNLSSSYLLVTRILIGLSLAILLIFVVRAGSSLRVVRGALLATFIVATIALTVLGQTALGEIKGRVGSLIQLDGVAVVYFTNFEIQKLGHVIVYMIIMAVIIRWRKVLELTFPQAVFLVVALGLYTEALQRHSLSRSPSLIDLGYNLCGIAAALFAYLCVRAVRLRRA
ncbi:MAG: VanZ family protein, partial [Granulosicoccus sp.]